MHNKYSPAQLSMGRKLWTRVPCHPDDLKERLPDYDLVRKKIWSTESKGNWITTTDIE